MIMFIMFLPCTIPEWGHQYYDPTVTVIHCDEVTLYMWYMISYTHYTLIHELVFLSQLSTWAQQWLNKYKIWKHFSILENQAILKDDLQCHGYLLWAIKLSYFSFCFVPRFFYHVCFVFRTKSKCSGPTWIAPTV